MDRGNTKQEILDVALELFSVKGFEATSLSTIADAVGIRKASLYSHFENKQAILDALVEEVLSQYNTKSMFARANWEDGAFRKEKRGLSLEDITNLVKEQIRFILHDPYISKARKMLAIEQFQNSELAKLQTKQNYTDVMQYFTGLMGFLMGQGVLAEDDPQIMAAQFSLPISVWINLCDREPEVMELMEKHIRQFFKVYGDA